MKTAAIILAAGGSSRLGKPKQLLQFNGKSLLKHTCEAALQSGCSPIVLITGKEHQRLLQEVPEGITAYHHEDWQYGIGSSISAGVSFLRADTSIGAVLILLSDQPFISAPLFTQLVQEKNITKKGIVACAYADTIGVPAIFDRKYFNSLVSLEGDEGAKKLLLNHRDDLSLVGFPQGRMDIDNPDDYQDLQELED